jgi:hypothetical protein
LRKRPRDGKAAGEPQNEQRSRQPLTTNVWKLRGSRRAENLVPPT